MQPNTSRTNAKRLSLQHLLLVQWWLYDSKDESLIVAIDQFGDDLPTALTKNNLYLVQRLQFGRQILCAIQFLHNMDICHGDLRPEAIQVSYIYMY